MPAEKCGLWLAFSLYISETRFGTKRSRYVLAVMLKVCDLVLAVYQQLPLKGQS